MVTRVIPHEEWAEFLDDLSEVDETVLVTVEMLGNDLGDQIIARSLPLQGLTLVEKGSDAGEIEIILGSSQDEHFSHVISHPILLSILETEDGLPQTLQIKTEEEATVLLQFEFAGQNDLADDDEDEDDE